MIWSHWRLSAPLLAFAYAVGGCYRAHPVQRVSVDPTAVRVVRTSSVQTSPPYRESERRFWAKDYRGALSLLDTLAQNKALSSGEKTFLDRQRQICLGQIEPQRYALASAEGTKVPPRLSPPEWADCGPRALQIVLDRFGINAELERLRREAAEGKR